MKATILSCAFGLVSGCLTDGEFRADMPVPPIHNQPPEDESIDDVFQGDGVAVAFFLSTRPSPGTLEMRVVDHGGGLFFLFTEAVGDPPVGDFTYDPPSNSVRLLRYVPPVESEVFVTYTQLSPPPSR